MCSESLRDPKEALLKLDVFERARSKHEGYGLQPVHKHRDITNGFSS